ncbi:hypothetical protein N7474_007699 [Penicillium riverlandense]|uniref:uncharacterized protein n=1 Tax=Penicillium riverlandense TaxID=1903569 RepID=UPI002547C1D3|nr:uncharacterized protein N7474_007699 [Penicillium riverlandense]KAJ5811398.1 hypothetical protein N7474_007699 [Penicillium riverlandense]
MDLETNPPLKPLDSIDQTVLDAHDLATLGHDQALSRKFSIWSMLALGFCVLGTWGTFAQDLATGLTNGGPVGILWGLLLVTICNICVALSLGELCSSMPTALGQAYWVFRLWNSPTGRFTSYLCAWINTFGWWTLAASANAFMTNFILGIKVMFDIHWSGAAEGWVQLLLYIGLTFLLTVVNLVSCRSDRTLPILNNFIGLWFAGLFVVISIVMIACVAAKPNLSFQSARFVFATWSNRTEWSDGVTWFIGLVQAAYGLTAFDSVIHMAEEIPAPRTNVPKTIWMSVVCGAVTGFIFMVICLFCIQNLGRVLSSPTGLPFIELIQSTVGLNGGAVLIAMFVANGLGQGVSIMTTSSRLTWGFARDGGIPWSQYFAHVDQKWKVPVRALWLQGALIAVVGFLYLGVTTVLEAILSVSTIALTISYCIPILTLLCVGRDKLPPGPFSLGKFGPTINWVSVVYCVITTVFFFFPGSPTPTPSDMNYAIAVFGVMLVIAIGFWIFKGHKTYLTSEEAMNIIIQARCQEESAGATPDGKEGKTGSFCT